MANDSFEKDIETSKELPPKLDIPILKYFWQSNPLFTSNKNSIPRFLRRIKVLENFSDNELRLFSKALHLRQFADGEVIFKQTDIGVGFYFIYSGRVDIIVENDQTVDDTNDSKVNHVVSLDKMDYFGELALLQQQSIRNATAIARESCQLLGIFKPDLENLINTNPTIATKLLQAVSIITANRLFSVTNEVRRLKYKIKQLELESAKSNE
ncbi:putative cyclic nucleotide-binding protein [Halobacteriovorax marinus SJ]|uniref:Cyclic nucleotide-binding protein n=1 Tax=Halobacteriovorax marinus (strain ATCC BAA-682 / DSM 15412 / SJ) TaxID=862908 RepID=E1X139_HALMS|nr:cyclic nucleotide-binding domain-containing protein [Halobacteriovorax marinus]CBW28109.1 putative cyclic nucleotide-binding protein [Halobacteriovorax marinus SJ]